MKVLVTGGAGFIGSNLCRTLSTSSDISEVRIIDDLSTGSLDNIADLDAEVFEGSFLDSTLMKKASQGVDSIVHLGAIPSVPRSIADPRSSHEANASGTLNVLDIARQHDVGHVVVASSSSVYGSNPKLPKSETDWTRPMSPYAVSKLATEGYALAYQAVYGMRALAFRFFNVYGPGQSAGHAYAAVVPKFIEAALKSRPLQVHGDGTQSRDFTYVQTVCDVLHQAVVRQVASVSPVNLAFNTNTALLELIAMLEQKLGYRLEREHAAPRIGDVRASQADDARVRELFPEVTPVNLEAGLDATLAWYKSVFG